MNLHRHSNSTAMPATLPTARPQVSRPDVDIGGIVAPWWEDVVIDRVATSDGQPMSLPMFAAYRQLFDALSVLEQDEEVDAGATARARRLLQRCMFAGAYAPKLTWHGNDAIVLFWTTDRVTSFFTITANEFSFLEERDGVITKRRDDQPLSAWDSMFPIPNGRH